MTVATTPAPVRLSQLYAVSCTVLLSPHRHLNVPCPWHWHVNHLVTSSAPHSSSYLHHLPHTHTHTHAHTPYLILHRLPRTQTDPLSLRRRSRVTYSLRSDTNKQTRQYAHLLVFPFPPHPAFLDTEAAGGAALTDCATKSPILHLSYQQAYLAQSCCRGLRGCFGNVMCLHAEWFWCRRDVSASSGKPFGKSTAVAAF